MADIPKTLLDNCHGRIRNYTVGFVRVEQSKSGQDAILLGSGILVKTGNVCAILTADHVRRCLPTSGRLGLILSDKVEQTTIDISQIQYVSIARGDDESLGPDIGAVLLLDTTVSSLEARKTFYNLDLSKERMLKAPPDIRAGLWIVQGFVNEMTTDDLDPFSNERSKGFCMYGAFGGVEDYISNGDHDYYTFPIPRLPSKDIPHDFGGCSGGGLWLATFKRAS